MSMPTFLLLPPLALAAVLAPAAAHAQQLRPVSAFDKLSVSGACDVVLTQGAGTQVRVQAAASVEPHIRTEVQNGTLRIYRDNSALPLFGANKVTVYVTCPHLSSIESSGASDVKSESTFAAETFRIKASGASDVTLRLTATALTVDASGASDVHLAGRADRQQVHLSGSSDYRASDLRSRTATVEASGASDAYVFVEESLSARSSGASDVHNKGNARPVR